MAKLGQLLVARGWITVQQLTRALKTQSVVAGRLGTCLLEMDVLTEDLLLKGLSEQHGVPSVGLEELHGIPEEVRELVPARLARRCRAVPFRAVGQRLDVALLDPRNLACQDEIAFATGRRVQVHVALEIRIFEALEKYYDEECPSRFELLLDRLNRSRYMWDREPAEAPRELLLQLDTGPEPEPPTNLGRPSRLELEPPPLPEPALPPSPRRVRVPLPPALSMAPAVPGVLPAAVPPASPAEISQVTAAAHARAAVSHPAAAAAAASAPAAAVGQAQSTAPGQAVVPTVAPDQPAAPNQAGAPAPAFNQPSLPPRPRSLALTAAERAALSTGARPPVAASPEVLSLEDLMASLTEIRNRDEVADRLLAFLARRYGHAALFQASREKISAWRAATGIDAAAFASFELGFDRPSVFLNLRHGSGAHLGPLPPMPAHRELAATWGGELPRQAVLLPVRIKERLVAVIYADSPRPSLGLHLEELKRLTDAVAGALSRCILLKKQASTGV